MEYIMNECAICGFKAKTPRGAATHIRNKHGLLKEDYIKIYGDYATVVIDNNKLKCPICGLPNFENVKIHLKHIHKLSDKEICKYPEDLLVLPSYRENASKGGKTTHLRFLQKHPDHVPYTPKYKSKSEASKAMWQNEAYRKMQSEKCANQHKHGLTDAVRKRKSKFIYKDGTYMRSTWELKVAEFLDSQNVEWKYEGVCIHYINPKSAKKCRYYPDFYLPQYNLVIEVKPLELCHEERIVAKKEATKACGYKFKFLTEVELENLEEFFKAETIH